MTKNQLPHINDWKREDLAFAASELSREFVNTAPNLLNVAVESAASLVTSKEGRVKLLKEALRRLRAA